MFPTSMDLPPWELFAAAFLIGIAKTGFSGISLLSIYLLSEAFGARDQTGLALPMLIFADLCVYQGFRRHGGWAEVWKLLPPCIVGLVIGAGLLSVLDNQSARPWIGGIVIAMGFLTVLRGRFPGLGTWMQHHSGFAFAMGFLGGATTMLANAAGPLISIYLLARGFQKMDLLGTGARFFLLINLLKVPLLAGQDLINAESLTLGLWAVPAIILGVWLGRRLILVVPQRLFVGMIIAFSILAGFRLLWP